VEALIFSTDGKLLLHKRGKGCRDEIGKREGIGGGFEESDENFLNALNREIKEEVGQDAQIEVDSFFEIRKDTVRDVKANQEQHRIIISYLCTYIGGELKIMEPHKNEGFSFVDIHTVEEKTLSSSAFSALQSLKKNQLSTYDPSKYAVYQMAEYALQDS
jgi:ADP-ribose pyrophosphatase YjhB (NUDIX family)